MLVCWLNEHFLLNEVQKKKKEPEAHVGSPQSPLCSVVDRMSPSQPLPPWPPPGLGLPFQSGFRGEEMFPGSWTVTPNPPNRRDTQGLQLYTVPKWDQQVVSPGTPGMGVGLV